MTKRSATTKSVASRTIGSDDPGAEDDEPAEPLAGLLALGVAGRRRAGCGASRRAAAGRRRSPSPIQAPPIIHQKRLAMSRAWWLSGASAFWVFSPQPASSSGAAASRARRRSRPVPSWLSPRVCSFDQCRRSLVFRNGSAVKRGQVRSADGLDARPAQLVPIAVAAVLYARRARTLARRGRPVSAGQARCLRRRPRGARARRRLTRRLDRRGAALLGAHAAAPADRRPRAAAARARPVGTAPAPAARAAAGAAAARADPPARRAPALGGQPLRLAPAVRFTTRRSSTRSCTRSSTPASSRAGCCSGRRCSGLLPGPRWYGLGARFASLGVRLDRRRGARERLSLERQRVLLALRARAAHLGTCPRSTTSAPAAA